MDDVVPVRRYRHPGTWRVGPSTYRDHIGPHRTVESQRQHLDRL